VTVARHGRIREHVRCGGADAGAAVAAGWGSWHAAGPVAMVGAVLPADAGGGGRIKYSAMEKSTLVARTRNIISSRRSSGLALRTGLALAAASHRQLKHERVYEGDFTKMVGRKQTTIDSTPDSQAPVARQGKSSGTTRRNLVLGGAAGLFLAACSNPNKPAASTSTDTVQDPADPTQQTPAPMEIKPVDQLDIILQSAAFAALSPEKQGTIRRLEAITDLLVYTKEPFADRDFYAQFMADVYFDYTKPRVVEAFQHNGDDDPFISQWFASVGDGHYRKDMTGEQIMAIHFFKLAEIDWSMTQHSVSTVLKTKMLAAAKLWNVVSPFGYNKSMEQQTGHDPMVRDDILDPQKAHYDFAIDYPIHESGVFTSKLDGKATKVIYSIGGNAGGHTDLVFKWEPVENDAGGDWTHTRTIRFDDPAFLDRTAVTQTEILAQASY
jgi:hypothetical protein